MKKKLTSALALAMAMALTFGMTVCAAGSSATPGVNADVTGKQVAADVADPADATEKANLETQAADLAAGVTATNADGSAATVTALTAGELKDVRAKAGDIALAAVSANSVISVVAGADVEAVAGVITINFPNFVREAGVKYMVLHLNEATNVWETVDAEIVDGKIVVNLASTSPIVIVKVAEKAPAAAGAATSPAESPKTGETLPVAGIMAVICLAGAVVCAKKVRLSK